MKKRLNVKKITSIEEIINKPYSKVIIELKENFKINEIKEILCQKGNTKIEIVINNENKKVHYLLQNSRKFDLKDYKALKTKEYVKKITV